MGFWKVLTNWNTRKETSDVKRIKVTSGGAFYMKSKDIFNNKKETVELIQKLNKSVDKYNSRLVEAK